MKTFSEPRKKLALLLFGVSKIDSFHHPIHGNYHVDYKYSVNNYHERIFKYFHDLGYDIDIYFATNNLNKKDRSELIATYPAVDYDFQKTQSDYVHKNGLSTLDGGRYFNRNIKFRKVLNLCLNSGNKYDLILATRFDLIFMQDFRSLNFNLDLMNICSILEKRNVIDDNFYLFPGKILEDFTKNFTHCFKLNLASHTL